MTTREVSWLVDLTTQGLFYSVVYVVSSYCYCMGVVVVVVVVFVVVLFLYIAVLCSFVITIYMYIMYCQVKSVRKSNDDMALY